MRYKLKPEVSIHLQGLFLIALGVVCHKVQADGAAIFFWCFGGLMAMPNIGKINRFLFKIAKIIVRKGRREEV